MENITLSQIGIYNTQRVTDSQSKALFIARHRQFDTIMNSLAESKADDCPQHHLIVAQRGMGKTTMLKRIEVELKSAPWNERYLPVLFPEEQYNIQDLSSFWLNAIDALADLMEISHDYKTVDEIDNVVNNLEKISDSETRASEAYKFIQLFPTKCKKRLVLLIDNLNMIFSRLSKDEQHNMRALMSENGAPIIVGASPIMINEVMDYDAPFYDSFRIHIMEKLSLEEITSIILNLADLTGSDEIKEALNTHTSRIKALYQLAGGNPRTAVILFRLLSRGFSPDINDDLEALLDDLTPVYKGRLEELSDQLQIIVDAIALAWEPVTLEQIRTTTRLENGQLSPQLKRLIDTGWIERPSTRQGKGGAYELTERIFNIWYLMRRSSRRHKKSIHCLSKFMEIYYSGELDQMAEKYLSIPFRTTREVITALALAKLIPDSSQSTALCTKSRHFIFEHSDEYPDLLLQLGRGDLYPKAGLREMITKLQAAVKDGEYTESHYIIESMLTEDQHNLDDEDKYLLTYDSAVIYRLENNYEKAEEALRAALKFQHTDNLAELLLIDLLSSREGNRDEALTLANALVAGSPDNIEYLKTRANVNLRLQNYELAINDLLSALKITSDDIETLMMLGDSYNSNGDYVSGLKVYSTMYHMENVGDKVWKEYSYTLIANNKTKDAKQVLRSVKETYGDDIDFYYISGELALAENRLKDALKLWEECMKFDERAEIITERLAWLYVTSELYDKAYQLCVREAENNNFGVVIKTGNYIAFTVKDYIRAEACYKLCLNTSYNIEGHYLMLHLYRDYLYDMESAQIYLDRLSELESQYGTDILVSLEKMLMEFRLMNIGTARETLATYIEKCKSAEYIQYPGMMYAMAQIARMNRLEDIIDILEKSRMDIEDAPIYHAARALTVTNVAEYFDKIPYEIRSIAYDIYENIKYYI